MPLLLSQYFTVPKIVSWSRVGAELMTGLLLTGLFLGGCSLLPRRDGPWQTPDISLPDPYHPQSAGPSLYDADNANLKHAVNAAIVRKLPVENGTVIEIVVKDGENLIDGQSLAPLFGARYFPSPRLKAKMITVNSGIKILRPTATVQCRSPNPKIARYILSVTVSDYDDKTRLELGGNNPFLEDKSFLGGFEGDFETGSRSSVDNFKLKSELFNCQTGEVVLARSTSVAVTSTNRDRSVYLFAKILGWYHRKTLAISPGLNNAKDLALDAFLSGIFMEISGVTAQELKTVKLQP